MNSKEEIEALRATGYRVRVSHRRPWTDVDDDVPPYAIGPDVEQYDLITRRELDELNAIFMNAGSAHRLRFLPKGGVTVVDIEDTRGEFRPGVTHAMGQSVCSPRDNFNKKLGTQIALGRALKAIWPEG